MQKQFTALHSLLSAIGLSPQECQIFEKAYTFPGLTPRMLGYQCGFSRMTGYRVLERLVGKGLLTVREHLVYPISLHELSQRLTQISSNVLALAETFTSIEKLHSPGLLQHAGSMQLLKNDASLEAFDDMHRQSWEWNIALGDFESYGQKTDPNFNRQWVKKRVKKGRKAKGVITASGPFTKEFTKDDEAVFRKTCFVKNFIKDQWIETFPEIGTTFIFSPSLTEDHTIAALKIQNKAVTNSYVQIVKAFLP